MGINKPVLITKKRNPAGYAGLGLFFVNHLLKCIVRRIKKLNERKKCIGIVDLRVDNPDSGPGSPSAFQGFRKDTHGMLVTSHVHLQAALLAERE